MNSKIFICDCNSIDHQLVITDDNENIYFLFHLEDYNTFWHKLKKFIPFLFKWENKSEDGNYIIFSKKTEIEIKKYLQSILSEQHE
jgi:hypothetical protein